MNTDEEWPAKLPLLIRLVGLLWIAVVVGLVSEDTFFSGDAGLKALQVYQFAEGRATLALDLAEPGFARPLYDAGFYPLDRPFVYRIDGRFFSTFPVAFQATTAPFFALFGFRGLYVWPLLGLWMTWAAVDSVSRTIGLAPRPRAAVLAVLVFGSPLSIYGALFWEHTLAVGLCASGWAVLVKRPTPSSAFVGGALMGSAVWLREEMLLLVALSGVASIARVVKTPRSRGVALAALAGLLAPVALWLAFNQMAYGAPLPLRSLQFGAESPVVGDLPAARKRFLTLASSFLTHFPPALMLLGFGGVWKRGSIPAGLGVALMVGAAFFFLLPLGVPNDGGNQWGPRYLLVLLPLVAVSLGWITQYSLVRSPRTWGPTVALGLTLLTLPAVRLNAWVAPEHVLHNSRSRAEPLGMVRSDPHSIVIVSQQFASHQLAALFREKTFFRAHTGRGLKRLAEQLAENGHTTFLYLCDPEYPCPSALEGLPESAVVAAQFGVTDLTLTWMGEWGRYVAYRGEIAKR